MDKLTEISLQYITKRFGSYTLSSGINNNHIYFMRDNVFIAELVISDKRFKVKHDIFYGLERTLGLKNRFETVKYFNYWLEVTCGHKEYETVPRFVICRFVI
jgi:hypothetical protein